MRARITAESTSPNGPLLVAKDLRREFVVGRGFGRPAARIQAVAGVSLEIHRGEAFGLVGESGSGKTTLGNLLAGLDTPTSGQLYFDGIDLTQRRAWTQVRRRIQVIFQDPQSSLDPRMSVAEIIAEPLRVAGVPKRAREQAVRDMAERVGLPPEHLNRRPHEFSGGQRQRIAIARALMLRPEFVVLDEPTSALDVSIQAQVLSLLKSLREELGMSYFFITHNIGVVRLLCDRVGVMYLGQLVEVGPVQSVLRRPRHPYTRALLAAVPRPHPGASLTPALVGDPPSPANPPSGCPFQSRCPFRQEQCGRERPPLIPVEDAKDVSDSQHQHLVACHYHREVSAQPLFATG